MELLINLLRRREAGRATFLPMDTIKPRDFKESGLDDCYGFVGLASDLCDCKPEYDNILKSLLGRIVVAEDLNCATSIAKKYGYRFKVVTLDGQVVNAGGSLTGGSLGGLIELRDVDVREELQSLNTMVMNFADLVNDVHRNAIGANNVTGLDFFVEQPFVTNVFSA